MEKEQKIIKNLIEKYNLKRGQYIDYNFFLVMYEDVKSQMSQKEFALLLGMTESKYKNIRFYNGKGSILTDKKLSEEEKNEILEEIIIEFDLSRGQLITYEKTNNDFLSFLELYEPYKEKFSENEFANLLGIKTDNLRNLRRGLKSDKKEEKIVHKARILMAKQYTEQEKIDICEKIIKKDESYEEGKKIKYSQLKKMHKKYKSFLTEEEFAELLGIRHDNYWTIKYNDTKRAVIKNFVTQTKCSSIKIETRFYTAEEIETICTKLGITKKDFICYIIQKEKMYNPQPYLDSLEKNKGLWIGSYNLTYDFVNSNYEKIIKRIGFMVNRICHLYDVEYYRNDLECQAIEYAFSKCGDIEKNFSYDSDQLFRLLYLRIRKYIIKDGIEIKKDEKKKVSLDKDGDFLIRKISKNNIIYSLDNEVSIGIEEVRKIVEFGKQKGYNKNEIVELILKNTKMSKRELLDLMNEALQDKDRDD